MPTFTITNPKLISHAEFEGLRGTETYLVMLRNHLKIDLGDDTPSGTMRAVKIQIKEWITERVESLVHMRVNEAVHDMSVDLYFESDAEMIAFTLTFNGEEVDLSRDPNHNKGRPVKPTTSGPMPLPAIPTTPKIPVKFKPKKEPWKLPPGDEGIWMDVAGGMSERDLQVQYGDDLVQKIIAVLHRGK